jgi:hypothetical protein
MLTDQTEDDGVRVAVRASADVRAFRSIGAGGAIARVWPHLLLLAALGWSAAMLARWAARTAIEETRTTLACDRAECVVHRPDGSDDARFALKGLRDLRCGDSRPETRTGDVYLPLGGGPQRQVMTVRTATSEALVYATPEPGPMPTELHDACTKLGRLVAYANTQPTDTKVPDGFRAELPGPVVPGTAARGLALGRAAIGLLALFVFAFAIQRLRRIRATRFAIDRGGDRLLAYEGRWLGRKRELAIPRAELGEVTLSAVPDTRPAVTHVTLTPRGARSPSETLVMHEAEAEELARWVTAFRDDPRARYRG